MPVGQAPRGWGEFGAGAATGGALGLLLGSKRGRSFGGKAFKYGSMAALGVVAYRAYGAWQARQAQVAGRPPALAPLASADQLLELVQLVAEDRPDVALAQELLEARRGFAGAEEV